MTFFNPSLLTRGARLARLAVVCVLLGAGTQAVALTLPQRVAGMAKGFSTGAGVVPSPRPTAYLAALGPSGFRFAPPPLEPEERPAPVSRPVEPSPVQTAPEPVQTAPAPDPEPTPAPPTPTEPVNKPVSILPDDTPRDVRAEDVLPFFQLAKDPAGGATASVVVPFTPATPQAAPLPPSSATYQLK